MDDIDASPLQRVADPQQPRVDDTVGVVECLRAARELVIGGRSRVVQMNVGVDVSDGLLELPMRVVVRKQVQR